EGTDKMENLEHGHSKAEIKARLLRKKPQNVLREFVYGGIDGTVTTFAVVAGGAGANLSSDIVLILGGANLLGDGLSMAVGAYQGSKAEQELRDKHRRIENRHIDVVPEGEREELRQLLALRGYKEQELEKLVQIISSN